MRLKLSYLLLTVLLPFTAVAAQKTIRVLPEPISIVEANGEFSMRKNVKLECTNPDLQRTAEIFLNDLKDVYYLENIVSVNSGGNFTLSIDRKLEKEEYRLVVTAKSVKISGGSAAGVFYALQTVKQLLNNGAIPAVTIKDKPYFAYRGAHLDVARYFFTVDEVKKYIDIISLHKINHFHWHLTDDQGWRIEIKSRPELITKGSTRKQTVVGKHNVKGVKYDGKPHGGFYTQEQIRDIVKYAAERHITIIPEIDLPGHMQAALAAYPHLGCTGGPYELRCTWGVSRDVLCAGNEQMYEFLEDVLTEVCDLFPSKLIHIGGDECPKNAWQKCPKCQAKIAELGLKDDKHHKKEHYLQNYVMGRVEEFLNGKGRRIIGWDEILSGNASKTATIMVWHDQNHVIKAARRGNDVIATTRYYCYLDYCQTSDPASEPLHMGSDYLSVQQVYKLDPYDRLNLNYRDKVIGVQASVWTEFIADFNRVQFALLPRLAALAETAWAYDRKPNINDFTVKARKVLPKLYKAHGYIYAPYFFKGIE